MGLDSGPLRLKVMSTLYISTRIDANDFSTCRYSRKASQIQVSVAEHNLVGDDSHHQELHRKMVRVHQIVMHPSYVTRQLADDIALVYLDQPVEWNEFVQPACLPNPDKESFAGLVATASGWGWTDEVKNGKPKHTQYLSISPLT